MCYRGSLSVQSIENEVMVKGWDKSKKPKITSFNFNAFSNPKINIIAQDNPGEVSDATWGLVPSWGSKDPKQFLSKNQYTNNARGEEMYEKKSYKNFIDNGRCLILFDGFYEPHAYDKKNKQTYYCYIANGEKMEDRKIMAIGGIYSKIANEYYVSLVTTEANEFFSIVHNEKKRMPLVLAEDLSREWIEKNQTPNIIKQLVIEGVTKEQFNAHPISSDINKRDFHRDSPEVIEPVEAFENIFA